MRTIPQLSLFFLSIFFTLGQLTLVGAQETRIALVIGNGDYRFFKPQTQPINDARDLAEVLKSRQFDVTLVTDGTKAELDKAVKDFGTRLREPGAVGFFYYSGLKAVSQGKLYLPGVDAHMDSAPDLRFESLDMDFVLFRMRSANNPLNFLFLDITRDQPLSPEAKPVSLGLLQDLPVGVNLVFSQDPQLVQSDTPGRLSRMTEELLVLLNTPSLPFEKLIQDLGMAVRAKSAGNQQVLSFSKSGGQFLFNTDRPVLTLKTLETKLPAMTKLVMVPIPGGSFLMGSPSTEEKRDAGETQHSVSLSPYRISATEVPQLLYEGVTGSNPSYFKGPNLPVDQVTWFDAVHFCNLLSKTEGLNAAYKISGQRVTLIPNSDGYRLPTEAEWEYAARAGTATPFNTGTEITTDMANFNGMVPYGNSQRGQSREKTTEVASYPPNSWGLFDLHGNLWEWCWDFYGVLPSTAQKDPRGPASGEFRVSKGGSWRSHGEFLRSGARHYTPPQEGVVNIGFRVVRSGH